MPFQPPVVVPAVPPLPASDPLAALTATQAAQVAVREARMAVDRLLGHRVMRRKSAEVTAESSLRGARASADLEGAAVDLAALRESLRAGQPLDSPHREIVGGAVRVQSGLGSLVETWRSAPLQALARLHLLAGSGVLADEALGRPRTDQAADDPLRLGPAPAPDEVAHRMDLLARLVAGGSGSAGTRAPALVVASVVHAELLVLRPFGRLDGIVARAAMRLALVAGGLDPKAASAPEVGFVELRHLYPRAAYDYTLGDAEQWITHCGQAVALGAREGIAVCEAIQRGA